MLKQIWIAQCDLCGKTEKAKAVDGRYNDTNYTIPDSWEHGHNKEFHLCGKCAAKVYDITEGPKFCEGRRIYKGCLNSDDCASWKATGAKGCSMDCVNWEPQSMDEIKEEKHA